MAYVDFSILNDIDDYTEKFRAETALLEQCIEEYKKTIIQTIRTGSLSQMDIGSQLGMSKDWVSHIVAGRKRFPMDRLAEFAFMYGRSCNELLLGEKKSILLPNRLNAMVCRILDFPAGRRKKLCDSWIREYGPYIEMHSPYCEDSLVAERLEEIANDLCLPAENLFATAKRLDSEYIANTRIGLSSIDRLVVERRRPRLFSPLIYSAVHLDVPVDFFLAKDYTRTCGISYARGTARTFDLSDYYSLRILSLYLNLPKDKQLSLISDILATP